MRTKQEILTEIERLDNQITDIYMDIGSETDNRKKRNMQDDIRFYSGKIQALNWTLLK